MPITYRCYKYRNYDHCFHLYADWMIRFTFTCCVQFLGIASVIMVTWIRSWGKTSHADHGRENTIGRPNTWVYPKHGGEPKLGLFGEGGGLWSRAIVWGRFNQAVLTTGVCQRQMVQDGSLYLSSAKLS